MNRFLASTLAALAVGNTIHRPFRTSGFGAIGGARGSNPFPAPPRIHATGARHIPEPVVHQLEINQQPQPWQKHAAKLKARAVFQNLGWNERREAREARNAKARLPLADQQAA